jgi:hypothetical protein
MGYISHFAVRLNILRSIYFMIEHYSFGKIVIDGREYTSDVLIIENEVHSWWRAEGHVLNPEDLTEIFSEDIDTLVVGTGASGLLKVPEKTEKYIRSKDITLIVQETGEAVKKFNSITGKKAAAFHLTC